MKYVRLVHPQTGETQLRFSLGSATHAVLAAPLLAVGFQAKSAGFIEFLDRSRFRTFGESTSLQVGPHPDDARMISAFYSAMLTMNADAEKSAAVPA